jgi:Glycosyl transferase family 2
MASSDPQRRRPVIDRVLGLSLVRRALASMRWRSGLDDDLRQLAERIDAVETASEQRVRELHRAAATRREELRSRTEEIALAATTAEQELIRRLETVDRGTQPARVSAELLFWTNWSSLAPLSSEPTVSVVLATRDRPQLLRRAIDSVLHQTYSRWELIVVDDGDSDEAREVVDDVGDERVRVVRADGSGAARARNLGLQAASGSIVAFLDDDNLMALGWLRAVVVRFEEHPDSVAVYGAQLRAGEQPGRGPASLLFVSPFDWERLLEANYIDLGSVAHRNGLDGLSFDEELERLIDWDYVVNLAGRFGLESLPVVASLYTTDAHGRITRTRLDQLQVARLKRRFRDSFGTASVASALPSTRGSAKAWASGRDADLLEEILLRQARRLDGGLRVLEWGSGLSTVHYPAWLAEQGIRVRWITLEHDRQFFRQALEAELRKRDASIVLAEELGPDPDGVGGSGITAVVFDQGPISPFDENPERYVHRATNLDHYVGLPARLGLRFDAVIVDGRKRRRCLLEAASLLAERGVAILHDAQRPYYHCAFGAFRSGRRIGDELWVGAQDETDFADLVPARALSSPGFDYLPGS